MTTVSLLHEVNCLIYQTANQWHANDETIGFCGWYSLNFLTLSFWPCTFLGVTGGSCDLVFYVGVNGSGGGKVTYQAM